MISRIHAHDLLVGDIVFSEKSQSHLLWIVLAKETKYNYKTNVDDFIITLARFEKNRHISISTTKYFGDDKISFDNFLVARSA